VKKEIYRIIQNFSFSADTDEWHSVLIKCKNVPSIFHLLNTTNYYTAYYSKYDSVNLSLVLFYDNKSVGVMPLMVHKNIQKEWVLSSNGIELVEPIFVQFLTRKVKKKLESKLYNLVIELSKLLNIKQLRFVNTDHLKLSSWYLMWADKACEIFVTHHFMVDLSLPLDEIRSKFRKSFRPLINKGLREWNVEIHEQVSEEMFDKFRLLHKKVSGQSTRPIESWKKQKEQIDSSESILITVLDKHNNLVGAGLFTYSTQQSLYCVGVYKRELFDKPLGHVVQMKAIQFFKNKKLRWYEVGQKHLKVDKETATDKEISISHFKKGFATQVVAKQHLIVNICQK